MITGKDYFNIINLSYLFILYEKYELDNLSKINESRWMFSLGVGTKHMSPALVMVRYVWGPVRG